MSSSQEKRKFTKNRCCVFILVSSTPLSQGVMRTILPNKQRNVFLTEQHFCTFLCTLSWRKRWPACQKVILRIPVKKVITFKNRISNYNITQEPTHKCASHICITCVYCITCNTCITCTTYFNININCITCINWFTANLKKYELL